MHYYKLNITGYIAKFSQNFKYVPLLIKLFFVLHIL